MADATLVFRVPVELQDIIINVVDQILNVKDLLSYQPNKNSDIAFSTGKASVASNSKEIKDNNTLSYAALYATGNATGYATGKEESKEEKREIVKEKNEEKKEEPQGFEPPNYEEVFSYMRETNSRVNPGRFYNWMKAHNWVDGRGDPITDWKQKLEEWEKREDEINPPRKKTPKLSDIQSAPRTGPIMDDTDRLLEQLTGQKGIE